jgi:hypothetical protein
MFERIEGLVCWKCGASLEALSLPLRRLDECPRCHAELHVCRLCEFFDTAVAKSCREPVAEEVKDKTRANFCDYFRPRPGAHVAAGDGAAAARSQLEALFGGTPAGGDAPPDEARTRLEELFGGSPAKKGP